MENSRNITFNIKTNFLKDLVEKNENSKYVEDIRIMEFIEFGYIASRYVSCIRKKLQKQYPDELVAIQNEMKHNSEELHFIRDDNLSLNEIIKRDSIDIAQVDFWKTELRNRITECLC